MYIILWRESFTTNNTYYFLLHFFLFPLFQRIRDASVAIIKRALAILQLFAIRWDRITLTISILRRQGLLSCKLLISVCVLHFADQFSVFMFSVSLVVLGNRYKTRLYRKLHLLLCLDTCKWPFFCLFFFQSGNSTSSAHGIGSFRPKVDSPHDSSPRLFGQIVPQF